MLDVTGTTVTTPRPSRVAVMFAPSLLTITAGRRLAVSAPRVGSRSTILISPRRIRLEARRLPSPPTRRLRRWWPTDPMRLRMRYSTPRTSAAGRPCGPLLSGRETRARRRTHLETPHPRRANSRLVSYCYTTRGHPKVGSVGIAHCCWATRCKRSPHSQPPLRGGLARSPTLRPSSPLPSSLSLARCTTGSSRACEYPRRVDCGQRRVVRYGVGRQSRRPPRGQPRYRFGSFARRLEGLEPVDLGPEFLGDGIPEPLGLAHLGRQRCELELEQLVGELEVDRQLRARCRGGRSPSPYPEGLELGPESLEPLGLRGGIVEVRSFPGARSKGVG